MQDSRHEPRQQSLHCPRRHCGRHATRFSSRYCKPLGTTNASGLFFHQGKIGLEKIMTRSARIGLTTALLVGGATIAMAQNGPPTGGYPPARWNPNFYGHYGYHHRYYAYYPVYPTVAGYWDYYRTSWPGRGNDEESTR
jgi:hypothetical protein